MKNVVLIFGFFLASSAFAGNRISNELATVKACNEAVAGNLFDLSAVYDASVADSGKTLTVELSYKSGNADCKQWSWYKHDGTKTVCEPCQEESDDGSSCACASGMCMSSGGPAQMQYIDVNR